MNEPVVGLKGNGILVLKETSIPLKTKINMSTLKELFSLFGLFFRLILK